MFGISSSELVIIMVVALIVLGPKNLPGIARSLGKAMGEFRKVSTDFQRTINMEIAMEEHETRKKEETAKQPPAEAATPDAAQASDSADTKDAA